jgi:alpha-glutamyl/putrescinyl thymine pyrophosphorylase-like protein
MTKKQVHHDSCSVEADEQIPGCESHKVNECSPVTINQQDDSVSTALVEQILSILQEQGFQQSEREVARFADHIKRSERKHLAWKRYLQNLDKTSPANILWWIAEAHKSGDYDEALWRGFLAGHFGNNKDGYESAARVLCAFGDMPFWTWDRVSSDLLTLKQWLANHKAVLAKLKFANHRKYESKKPEDLFRVLNSFIKWVKLSGQSPRKAFAAEGANTPEARFDLLYKSLEDVWRLGRTARFDMLHLLGDLGILSVKPGSCYLVGATGPLKGAQKFWGSLRPKRLSELADQTARRLEVPMNVFEDALCNWQK